MAQNPTEEILNITRKFLGGEQQLPDQAAPEAQQRSFGQQGARKRAGGGSLIQGPGPSGPPQSLSNRLFDLPGPVGFAQTPQGRAILQRILGGVGRRV